MTTSAVLVHAKAPRHLLDAISCVNGAVFHCHGRLEPLDLRGSLTCERARRYASCLQYASSLRLRILSGQKHALCTERAEGTHASCADNESRAMYQNCIVRYEASSFPGAKLQHINRVRISPCTMIDVRLCYMLVVRSNTAATSITTKAEATTSIHISYIYTAQLHATYYGTGLLTRTCKIAWLSVHNYICNRDSECVRHNKRPSVNPRRWLCL
jgi:hypothetical protein